jgi:membrane protein required for colicin V production
MTVFDLIALAVVAFSALSGFNKGAAAELLGLFALGLSALATVVFLPATAPIARHLLHAGWVSAVVAAVVTFVIVLLVLRLLASTLTSALNRTVLGGVNRALGMVFGALRGVVILALFAVVFNRATPAALKPDWITSGFTYPLASNAGGAVMAVLPKTMTLTGGVGGALRRSITEQSAAPDDQGSEPQESVPQESVPQESVPQGSVPQGSAPQEAQTETAPSSEGPLVAPRSSVLPNAPTSERAKAKDHGYTRRARDSVDVLVERSK